MSVQELPARVAAAPPAPASTGRLLPLDGIRGLAALVVVVHHALLTWPALANQYDGPNRASGTWWLAFTPLHLVWAGTEAVIVFFVLSGIVLTRPYLLHASSAGTWRAYYARRLLRLYVPVLVALALAGAVVRCFPRVAAPGVSWWFALHVVRATPGGLVHQAVVLDGGAVNTVLWSLRYEVVFSLVLPLVVLAVRRWPRTVYLNLPLALATVGLGQLGTNPFGLWLPYVAVGVALAAGWDDLRRLGERVQDSPLPGLVWGLLWCAAPVLLLANWWFRLALRTSPRDNAVAMPLVALGAALLCFLAVACPAGRRLFSSRSLQWAGRISFSLYLVQEPIVVSVSSLAGPGKKGVAVTVMLGGAVAIGVATVFHRLVERPAQRWARAIGRRLDAEPPPRRPPLPGPRLPAVPLPFRSRDGARPLTPG